MSRSIKSNAILKILLNVFNIIVPLTVGPYVARLFIKELYDEFNTVSTIVTIIISFTTFGVYDYGVRYISGIRDDKRRTGKLFTTLFVVSIITNMLGLIGFTVFYLTNQNANTAIYSVFSIAIFANIFLTEWMNEAYEMYKFIMIKTVLIRALYVVLVFVLIKKPEDVALYALLLTLSTLINNVSSFIYIKRRVTFDFSGIKNKSELFPVVSKLTSLVLIANANILYTQLDKLFITGFLPYEITFYVMAQTIIYTLQNVVNSIILVTVPRLSYLLSNNKNDEYLDLIKKSSRTFFLLIYPFSIGVATMSQFIIEVYGGQKYTHAGPVLLAFAVRVIVVSMSMVLANQVIYLYKKEQVLMRYIIIGGVINLCFNALLAVTNTLSSVTLVYTTMLAEIIVLIFEKRLVNKINPQVRIFTFANFKYLILSLGFIPISMLVKIFGFSYFAWGAMTICACIVYYFTVLLILKDKLLFELLNPVFDKIKSAVKRKN